MRRLQAHGAQLREAVQQGGRQLCSSDRIVAQGLQAGAAALLEAGLPQPLHHGCRLCHSGRRCCCCRGLRADCAAQAGRLGQRQLRQGQLPAGHLLQQRVLQLAVCFQAQAEGDLRLWRQMLAAGGCAGMALMLEPACVTPCSIAAAARHAAIRTAHLFKGHCAPVAARAEGRQQRLGGRKGQRACRLCFLGHKAEHGP